MLSTVQELQRPAVDRECSPRALALFETMMLDKETPLEARVECLHVSSYRIAPSFQSCKRQTGSSPARPSVALLAERSNRSSIFGKHGFGIDI